MTLIMMMIMIIILILLIIIVMIMIITLKDPIRGGVCVWEGGGGYNLLTEPQIVFNT